MRKIKTWIDTIRLLKNLSFMKNDFDSEDQYSAIVDMIIADWGLGPLLLPDVPEPRPSLPRIPLPKIPLIGLRLKPCTI